MFGHWYVVGNQRVVRVFSEIAPFEDEIPSDVARVMNPRGVKKFKLIRAIENPLGRVKTRDLLHQEKGIGVRSLGHFGTSVRYAETKRQNPHEQAANQFARNVVGYLQKERQNKKFSDLTIIAEPHFLGKLRAAMDAPTERKVVQWIKKDLREVTPSRLADIFLKGARA